MSIVTGTGDSGETGVIGGRLSKDHIRIQAYGAVDELNAAIGIALCKAEAGTAIQTEMQSISHWLFNLGCDLATLERKTISLNPAHAQQLRAWVEREEAALPPLRAFILPGGCALAADLHFARTVCRRAERQVVSLHQNTEAEGDAIIFLNRLSDLLFMYARRANHDSGHGDIEWKADRE